MIFYEIVDFYVLFISVYNKCIKGLNYMQTTVRNCRLYYNFAAHNCSIP
jgi:hypothetical protein